MVRVWCAAVVFSLCLAGAYQKPKTGEIDILEVTAHRGDDMIEIDGRVRNTSDNMVWILAACLISFVGAYMQYFGAISMVKAA